MKQTTNLPYRENVACVVFQGDKFLIIQNSDWEDLAWWRFPQGGKEPGETDEQTALRELNEELGTNKFKIVAKSLHTNKYDWDHREVIAKKLPWRGQIQHFLLIEFLGNNEDIKINKIDIRCYKWVLQNDLKKHLHHKHIAFKNYYETIEKILEEFNL